MASVFKRGGTKNRGGYWYVQWYDANGKLSIECTHTTNRATAERLAAKRQDEAVQRRAGLIDTRPERYATEGRRAIDQHVADFRAHLQARQNTAKHVAMTCRHVETIIERCDAERVGDLTGSAVSRVIAGLRADGLSLRTCNAYLRSVKSFTRWLLVEKRSIDDPLVGLAAVNEATDRRRVRRALTDEETTWLLRVTASCTRTDHALPGLDRAMLYRLAMETGFSSG